MAAAAAQKPQPTAGLVAKLCAEAAARLAEDNELSEIENELRRDLGGVGLSWDRSTKYNKQPYTSGSSAFFPAPPEGPAPTAKRPVPVTKSAEEQKSVAKDKETIPVEQPPPPPPPAPPPLPDTASAAEEKEEAPLGRLIFQGSTEMDGELHLVSIHEVPESSLHFISCIDLDKNLERTLNISNEEIIRASGSEIVGSPSSAQLHVVLKQLRLNAGVLSIEFPPEESAVEASKNRGSCIDMLVPADGSAVDSDDVRDKVFSSLLGWAESGQLEEVLAGSLAKPPTK